MRCRCGSEEFRAVVDHRNVVHLFCGKCGVEHVVDVPDSWVGWEEWAGGRRGGRVDRVK